MDEIISKIIGGVHWRVVSAFQDAPQRLASLQGRTVKRSRVREVIFLPAQQDGPALVLKSYRVRGLGALIRSLFLGAPAWREWKALSRLRSSGVAVPRPVAVGTGPPARSYLATERIEDCTTLEDLLLGKAPLPIARKDLARACGRLVRSMHNAGVEHRDLHAANILVDAHGAPLITDLHSARLTRRLSLEARIRDLVSLAGAFLIHGTGRDRFRFLRAYESALDVKAVARLIEDRARERLFWFLKKFDRRCLREGRAFQSLTIHDLSGMAERSDRALTLARALGAYPSEYLEEHGRLLHAGTATRVHEVALDENLYIVKTYIKPGWTESLKRTYRGTRARRCWLNYHRLHFRGLNVPKPVLFLEHPLDRSFVITEAQKGHVTLDLYLDSAGRTAAAAVLRRLAQAMAKMHGLFLSNRDMKAQNILISKEREVLFIDPDGVESMKDPYLHVLARDLMRLNASFTTSRPISLADRLRFLKTYMAHMRLPPSYLRELWRETVMLTWDKWERWKKTF